jgi:hypothetical protein
MQIAGMGNSHVTSGPIFAGNVIVNNGQIGRCEHSGHGGQSSSFGLGRRRPCAASSHEDSAYLADDYGAQDRQGYNQPFGVGRQVSHDTRSDDHHGEATQNDGILERPILKM